MLVDVSAYRRTNDVDFEAALPRPLKRILGKSGRQSKMPQAGRNFRVDQLEDIAG